MLTSEGKYNYNAFGDVIRTESYIDGQENVIGKTIEEAMFNGLVSAGFKMCHPSEKRPVGVYMTVNDQDKLDLLTIAKKFGDLGCTMYATKGTAKVINDLGFKLITKHKTATDFCFSSGL